MVSCEAHHLPKQLRETRASEAVKRGGRKALFLLLIHDWLDSAHTGLVGYEAFCGAGKGKTKAMDGKRRDLRSTQ
jgi:hypothetical protein